VFLQTGRKISELPLVVKKVRDIFELYRRMGIQPAASSGKVLISSVNFISLSSAPDSKESSVVHPDPLSFFSVEPIWIRIQEGKNDPQKRGKLKVLHVFC
jgi:hypothetical protein